MRAKAVAFAVTALFASVASGQTSTPQSVDRVFHFTNTQTPQGFKEVASLIRTIASIPQGSVDNEQRTLTVHGTADQVALAEWLFTDLDKPADGQPPAHYSSTQDYRVPGGTDDVARVFYLAHTGTPRGMQEIVNGIRSILEIQRIVVCNGPRAVALRGTAEQVAGAEWLINGLDRPADAQPQSQGPAKVEYRLSDARNPAARVFYLKHTATSQGSQEIVNAIRSILEIQRVVALNGPRALALRGTTEQVAAADWLIDGLDKPDGAQVLSPQSQDPAKIDYQLSDARTPAVRVFYLTHTPTPQGLQEIVNSIRSIAELQRVVACNGPRAVAFRGTPVQVALAERLIQERDKP
ncbi:MAG: hypothetical protein LAQ69_30170 [Acidobacteriia bacterium]|nr:hypothetical protein [Terriglobia bacterium]